MFDTMTFTKIMGGLCGALLIFLLGKWAAEEIYAMGGGHGDDHGPAYVIDTGGDEEETAAADEGPSFGELYAAADLASGEKVFGKCKACHAVEDGDNKTGPHLYAVVGRDVGAVSDFGYSGVLSEVASVWTPEELDAFLENPKGYAPGTTMGFAGLKKASDRADVIAYLDNTDGAMTEVAVPAATEEEAAAEPAAEESTEVSEAEETAAEAVDAEEPEVAEVEPSAEAEAVTEEATEDATEEATADTTDEASEEPAEEATADAGTGEQSAFAQLVAAADVAAGEKAYRKCAACHVADEETNRVGPHLVGLIGRDIASVDGFGYSDAMSSIEGAWDIDTLSAWLEDPKAFAPGNRMAFRGLNKEDERAAVIAYLQSLGQ